MDQLGFLLPYKGAVVMGTLALLLVVERLVPMAKVVGGLRRVAKNLSLAGLNAILSWAVVVPVSAFAASYALEWRPQWWSGWPGLLLDLLILDCWIYWWHRANHVWPFLWRFHEVHHLDEFLDASSVKLNEAIDRFILGDEPFAASLQPDLYGYNEYDQLMRLDEWQARGRSDGGAA